MWKNQSKKIKYVHTGELGFGGIETILCSGAIGSCVVISAYDPFLKIGAMVHIMLSGKSPQDIGSVNTKYATDAVQELFQQLQKMDSAKENIEVCIVGGANVLKRENDTIGIDNLNSVKSLLLEAQIEIKAESIGGFRRRTVQFDIEMGCVSYTIGDSKQEILWQSMSR